MVDHLNSPLSVTAAALQPRLILASKKKTNIIKWPFPSVTQTWVELEHEPRVNKS